MRRQGPQRLRDFLQLTYLVAEEVLECGGLPPEPHTDVLRCAAPLCLQVQSLNSSFGVNVLVNIPFYFFHTMLHIYRHSYGPDLKPSFPPLTLL